MATTNTYVPSVSQQDRIQQRNATSQAVQDRKNQTVQNAKNREDIQYTLFASGLRNGRMSEFESKNVTDDLAIVFDSVVQHSYTKDYNKTSYAVESKATASDHVVTQDGKFTFSAKVTDSPMEVDVRNYLDRDTNKDNPKSSRRPAKALEILETIADSKQLVTLVTEDNILTNYVITSLSFDRSAETGASIDIKISLEEFRFRAVNKVIMARADPKKAGNANSGNKQTASGGDVDDANKNKRKTPYLSKNAPTWERWENANAGTTDFSGPAGSTYEFDPNNLKR